MKATEGLYQTLSLSAKAIENLTKGDVMWPGGETKLSSDQALENVHVAEACEGHANLKTTLHGRAVENGTFHPSDHSDFSREMYEGPRVVFCRGRRDA